MSPSCDNHCSEEETNVEPALKSIKPQEDCCVALFDSPDDESLDDETFYYYDEDDKTQHATAELWKRIAKCMDDLENINEQAEDIKKGVDELKQSRMELTARVRKLEQDPLIQYIRLNEDYYGPFER